jgi:anhydro-N-acetylmuramic acid kinase
MSGTSADGMDVALVRISGAPPKINAELVNFTSLPFPGNVGSAVLRVAEGEPVTSGEISQLNFRLGQLFARACLDACRQFRISPKKIALIGSHGQTIFHQGVPTPHLGARVASTLQIGEPSMIAALTGITTVADFRPADMAVGGQGAPLVPFVDYVLYRHENLGRVALNLGGIGNVTAIPRRAKPRDVFAFDTGPGNMVIDALVKRFTRGHQTFDRNARMAQRGRCLPRLINELMRDAYLAKRPPKTAGREQYGHAFVERLLRLGRVERAKPADLVCTATIFTALSVIDAMHRWVLPQIQVLPGSRVLAPTKTCQLIVSGGGVHNPLIMAQLAAALPAVEVIPSSHLGVPEHAKEALAFAILAYETFHHRAANLPSATGARRPSILGKVCNAPRKS